jgi:2-keto-3-deoxy-L-rhamnonate aldolase RhmA
MHRRIAVWALALAAASPAQLWENPVKKLIKEGKPVIAGTVTIASADVAAHMANMGFDLLWIEMEHSPISLETVRNMVLATRGLKAVPCVRVPVNELWMAKRALDTGALGVIFPFTSTPELARQAAASTKYPPNGRRGSGPGLASFRWLGPEPYADFADRNVLTIIIIEEKRAVEQIEQIASSYSYGKRGNQRDPEVVAAIAKVLAAGKKYGLPVGRPAGTPELIDEYLKLGFQFIQGPSDLNMMGGGAAPLLKALGKSGIDPKKAPLY